MTYARRAGRRAQGYAARRGLLAGAAGATPLAFPRWARPQDGAVADTESEQPAIEMLSIGRSQLESQVAPGFDARLRNEALDVPRSQSWLHEGIATYVEGVARGRAGLVAPTTVWREWAKAMPQGQPQAGDEGLDNTPTWGRTYWGGAMFCLLADVRMLERSDRKAGLQQALQGVVAAGGSYAVPWPVQRILDTADAAVGQTTLAELYARMKDAPAPADLEGLWRELGVNGDKLDDAAPLAAVRRAILS